MRLGIKSFEGREMFSLQKLYRKFKQITNNFLFQLNILTNSFSVLTLKRINPIVGGLRMKNEGERGGGGGIVKLFCLIFHFVLVEMYYIFKNDHLTRHDKFEI